MFLFSRQHDLDIFKIYLLFLVISPCIMEHNLIYANLQLKYQEF